MTRERRGADLAVQAALWTPESPPPASAGFRAVSMLERWKPRGGMWTSAYLGPDELSGWAQWCRSEEWGCSDADLWLLTPEPDCPVYEIDTYDDLAHLHHCYGRSEDMGGGYARHWLDWSLIAERFAAVHLTDEGQWRTRMTMPFDLYGWDCESTLWLRWAFANVESGGLVIVNASALDQAVSEPSS